MRYCAYILILFTLFSCKNKFEREAEGVVREWTGKTIVNIPKKNYIVYNGDFIVPCTLADSEMMVVSYINRSESESCLLHLYDWENFIQEVDSISNKQVRFALIANPNNKYEFIHSLKKYNFRHPIYIDKNDDFNKSNKFPAKMSYHTFLIDKNNKVIFIGNPINSRQVRNSYINIIKGKNAAYKKNSIQSAATLSTTEIDFGHLKLGTVRKESIMIRNIGKDNLIILDTKTSCGCITITYSKEPIREQAVASMEITYHATSEGVFNKTVRVFCNTPDSPYSINIKGFVSNK